MELDFSDPARQSALKKAATLITSAYEILADQVGAPNPSDNAFLREAMVCAEVGLIWQDDRGGIDAIDPTTLDEVEIKSTKLDPTKPIQFPTSRAVSPTVINRFLEAGYWLFAVFDNYSNLAMRVSRRGFRHEEGDRRACDQDAGSSSGWAVPAEQPARLPQLVSAGCDRGLPESRFRRVQHRIRPVAYPPNVLDELLIVLR